MTQSRETPPSSRDISPLFGRADDTQAVAGAFDRGARLVVVTGPPGIGKTRLALAIAHAEDELVSQEGGRPPTWCTLAEARGVEGLTDSLALALDLQQGARPTGDAVHRIGQAIDTRGPILVILDDFDRFVPHADATLGRWLALAREARFLVTSRHRIASPASITHELGPLIIPDASRPLGVDNDAIALFCDRARTARGSYTLDAADAPFVASIVRALDGIPLAIELAAARMSVMGARAIAHRISEHLGLLTAASPRSRHECLEATIRWSYETLPEAERATLCQCTTFRGGFTVESAERVVDVGAIAGAPPVVDVIQSLRSRSLLFVSRGQHGGGEHGGGEHRPGELRLDMYASIRAFAEEALSPAERHALHARHAAELVATTRSILADRPQAGQASTRQRLLAERQNLLVVVERTLGRGPVTAQTAEPAIEALLVLAPVLLDRGPLSTYAQLLGPAIEVAQQSNADPKLLGRALAIRARLFLLRGQSIRALKDFMLAVELARKSNDVALEADLIHRLGEMLAERGEHREAEEHFERAATLYEGVGDRAGSIEVDVSRGRIHQVTGRLSEAHTELERALAAQARERETYAQARTLRWLAEIALDTGDAAEATQRLRESARIARDAEDFAAEQHARGLIAVADHAAGQTEQAAASLGAVIEQLEAMGFAQLEGTFRLWLGVLRREQGREAEAHAQLRRAVDVLEPSTRDGRIARAHLAGLEHAVGRADAARDWLTEAESTAFRDPVSDAVVALHQRHVDTSSLGATNAQGGEILEAGSALGDALAASLHGRLALRSIEVAAGKPPSIPPPPGEVLVVAVDGAWFRPPHGETVSLERRKPLRLLLATLAQARDDAPGTALPWDVLLEAGWPGERVIASAGAHRVRVAISTLRKLGLRNVLETNEDGYRLAPAAPLLRRQAP